MSTPTHPNKTLSLRLTTVGGISSISLINSDNITHIAILGNIEALEQYNILEDQIKQTLKNIDKLGTLL
jgi:hypothetical protein